MRRYLLTRLSSLSLDLFSVCPHPREKKKDSALYYKKRISIFYSNTYYKFLSDKKTAYFVCLLKENVLNEFTSTTKISNDV